MKDTKTSGLSVKKKRKITFLAIAIICMSFLFYSMVIPRSEISVTTTIHYSFSGICVGLQIKNSGTIETTETVLNVTVLDQDGDVEYTEEINMDSLPKGEKVIHSFSFSAPQRDTYTLFLNFTYRCDGQDYDESIEHVLEDYMNFVWKDKMRDWRI